MAILRNDLTRDLWPMLQGLDYRTQHLFGGPPIGSYFTAQNVGVLRRRGKVGVKLVLLLNTQYPCLVRPIDGGYLYLGIVADLKFPVEIWPRGKMDDDMQEFELVY
jgi:hypothetical protein